jgi:hypothetical protein
MPTYGSGNNEEYLVHIIPVLKLVEQKGTADEVKEAFAALVKVRKEMSPFFNFPEDKTVAKKEARKKKLSNLNESLKAKNSFAVKQAQKAYKLFHCFVVGKAQTKWDRIVNKMHTKNLWIGVNGESNKGTCVKSWISFMDCIKLHKLTIFPAVAAEKQRYYMQQTIKKPQQATVAYELFHCFVVGKAQTKWDRIVNKMHTKNLWIGVNCKSNKGTRMKSWISFMDCIKLHKLTIFPADAAEKQRYYMQQTIKKPQQATVRQFVSCMGVLNDYLAYLPTVFYSLIAIAGTKKMNVPFDESDLAGIMLNLVPSSWVNQYNMMHSTLPKNPRALLNNLEAIKQVMDEKHRDSLKVKAKEASTASAATKGSSQKRSASGSSGEL